MELNNNSESPDIRLERKRDRFPPKSNHDLNDLLEHNNETHTVREWASKLGVTVRAMLLRYSRYAAGKMDKDGLLAPGKPNVKQAKPEQAQIKDAFYTSFVKEVAPSLGKEMRAYMRTNEQGPGLRMLKDFAKFIPVSANEAVADSQKAVWAVIFKTGQLPEHYEPIEGEY